MLEIRGNKILFYFAEAQKGNEKVAGHLSYFEAKKRLARVSKWMGMSFVRPLFPTLTIGWSFGRKYVKISIV